MEQRAQRAARTAGRDRIWSLQCATDAVHELVRLVEAHDVPGWSWNPAPTSGGLDLRGDGATEPIPLVLADGHVLGTIRCPVQPSGEPADAALRALLETTVLVVAMERRRHVAADLAGEFERQARLDALTNLPNRRMWDEVLAQEQARCDRHGYRALVAIVDLDDLKVTNDEHGHLAGDMLLRLASRALRNAVRDTDVVARLGGDEFSVLAVEFDDGDAVAFGRRIEEHLAEADVSASVGVAVALPGTTLIEAVERADRSMYDAKRARKRP